MGNLADFFAFCTSLGESIGLGESVTPEIYKWLISTGTGSTNAEDTF